MASSTPRSSSASAALCGLDSPTAISHSSRLPTATRDVLQSALHLFGGVSGTGPEHRPVVEVEHRQGSPAPSRPRREMCTATRLFGQSGDRRPVQPGIADGRQVDLVGLDLKIRGRRLAVEVEREVIRREDLAERHRRRVLAVHGHVPVIDTESRQFCADEPAERIVTDTGDQCASIAQSCRGHRHVGGRAAEELPERRDVLQADADLERIDVDAASPDGEDVNSLVS